MSNEMLIEIDVIPNANLDFGMKRRGRRASTTRRASTVGEGRSSSVDEIVDTRGQMNLTKELVSISNQVNMRTSRLTYRVCALLGTCSGVVGTVERSVGRDGDNNKHDAEE